MAIKSVLQAASFVPGIDTSLSLGKVIFGGAEMITGIAKLAFTSLCVMKYLPKRIGPCRIRPNRMALASTGIEGMSLLVRGTLDIRQAFTEIIPGSKLALFLFSQMQKESRVISPLKNMDLTSSLTASFQRQQVASRG